MENELLPIPRLAITMGEAAGIGPELLVRAAQFAFPAQLIGLADPELLLSIAKRIGLPLELKTIDWSAPIVNHQPGCLWIEPFCCPEPVVAGELNSKNAATTLAILQGASQLALSGRVDAIVTAPVHKANLNRVAAEFLGHTEYFAELAGVAKVVMMLATKQMRMTLATTHLSLRQVPDAVTQQSLTATLKIIVDSLARFGLQQPKIAVCGLNPHAGEDGLLGTEEIEVIRPVIESFQALGQQVLGPFPADTLFTPQKLDEFDVFLAMYHDQGLPVIKAAGFGQCANVTLGLPYIRTSVDHGTALDIAGSYQASAESLGFAIQYAIDLFAGKLPR